MTDLQLQPFDFDTLLMLRTLWKNPYANILISRLTRIVKLKYQKQNKKTVIIDDQNDPKIHIQINLKNGEMGMTRNFHFLIANSRYNLIILDDNIMRECRLYLIKGIDKLVKKRGQTGKVRCNYCNKIFSTDCQYELPDCTLFLENHVKTYHPKEYKHNTYFYRKDYFSRV